ncbi:MAG: type II and III secretion system protein family protein [Alphaproteobacteria bacterium]|nr:type II and III secretion system protein family protein [Alphaproteobacteria bacterium]
MIDRVSGVLIALLLALALVVLGGVGQPVRADQVVPTQGKVLNLDIRKGTLIRLDEPVSTVFLADPAIADIQVKTPTLIYVYAKRIGETVLYGLTEDERVVLSRIVRVTHNLSRLRSALDQFLPGTTVRATSLDGALVLDGHVGTPGESEDLRRIAASFVGKGSIINRVIVTGANQVHLKVKIAEVSREVVKRLGINWESIINTGAGFLFGIATGREFLTLGNAFLRDETSDTVVASFTDSNVDINVLIDALDNEGLISVLAQPNLTAMSGETATFLAGGEFPIPVQQDEGAVTIEFKEFGVSLAFTPTIIAPERINLRVSPEVSQLSAAGAVEANNFAIPALTTRRAQTTVELGSGQSFAIAGLLQNNVVENIRKFPGLGDVPVLGRLFRSEEFNRNETELIILVTPYIVHPISDKNVALPTDGFVAPSDKSRVLHGKLYEESVGVPQAQPSERRGLGLTGPAGYILD